MKSPDSFLQPLDEDESINKNDKVDLISGMKESSVLLDYPDYIYPMTPEEINESDDDDDDMLAPEEKADIIDAIKAFAVIDYMRLALKNQTDEVSKMADELEQKLINDERYNSRIARMSLNVDDSDIAVAKGLIEARIKQKKLRFEDKVPNVITTSRSTSWVGSILVDLKAQAFSAMREAIRIASREDADEEMVAYGEGADMWVAMIKEDINSRTMGARIKEEITAIKDNIEERVMRYLETTQKHGLWTPEIDNEYKALIKNPNMITDKQARNLIPAFLRPYLTILQKQTISVTKG